MDTLFLDKEGRRYGAEELRRALHEIGAADCETLFIHSDVMFGRPPEGFKKRAYLTALYGIITSLGVRNIIVPTFTYSFPNGEDYDILNSRSSMGALSEFVRKQPERYRTDDPLLSVSVPDRLRPRFEHLGAHSLGPDSALDVLHHMEGVKFLFFGAEMADCFTYVHYVEKMLEVPYRFDMPFEGNVIYPDGHAAVKTQYIHTQCGGVRLPPKYDYFEAEMEEQGFLRKRRVADRSIACLSEEDAWREIRRRIETDIRYFVASPFTEADLVRRYTYSTDHGRITHC